MPDSYKYDLSVVIPVYNNEKEVCQTIQPFLNCKEYDYEIIFINDGSTDNSQAVLEKIKADNPQTPITIWLQDNQGVSVARNKGIELAQGEYILFCDADDKVSDSLIEKVVNKAKEKYDFIFWKHNINRTTGMQHLEYADIKCNELGKVLDNDLFLEYVLQDKFRLCMGTFAIRKDLLKRNHLWYMQGCRYGEDLEFILKVIMHSMNLCCIPEEMYTYIRRETSAMGTFTLQRFDAPFMVLRLSKYIKKNELKISDSNKEYLQTIYFIKQFIYSLESCLQHLKIKDYFSFWRKVEDKYPHLIEEGIQVLQVVSPEEIGYNYKRIQLMKKNLRFYSFCIMLKNSLKTKK